MVPLMVFARWCRRRRRRRRRREHDGQQTCAHAKRSQTERTTTSGHVNAASTRAEQAHARTRDVYWF